MNALAQTTTHVHEHVVIHSQTIEWVPSLWLKAAAVTLAVIGIVVAVIFFVRLNRRNA
jgi:hypothetical protein